MKSIMINILLLIAGVITIILVITYDIDDTLGWLMATVGVFLIFLSLVFRSKQPLKSIMKFYSNLF